MKETKQKIHFQINVVHILSFFIMLAGVFLLKYEVECYNRMEVIRPLNELSLTNISPGDYVTGVVDRCVGTVIDTTGGPLFQGSTVEYLTGLSETIHFYTVPVGKGDTYMTLLLTNEEEVKFGKISDIPKERLSYNVTGKIVKLPTEVNSEVLSKSLGLSNIEELPLHVSTTYGIRPIDFAAEKNSWEIGVCVIIFGLFVLVMFGDIKSVVVKTEEREQLNFYTDRRNMDEIVQGMEIRERKNKIMLLHKKYQGYIFRTTLYFMLTLFLLFCYSKSSDRVVWIVTLASSLCLVKYLLAWFINSSLRLAQGISSILSLDSVARDTERLNHEIELLEQMYIPPR